MTTGLGKPKVETGEEPLVITKSGDGYKVYSVNMPARSYQVTGTLREPACTCPEFKMNQHQDQEWRCRHILAVFQRDGIAAAHLPTNQGTPLPEAANGYGYMLLKRSVSPDGRIDSLSVEFSCPTNGAEHGELVSMAAEVLEIQRDIVSAFKGNGRGGDDREPPQPPPAPTANGHPIPATLVGVEGMNGRWGRRLFLTFDVQGRTVKLFGTLEQLSAAVADAGLANRADNLREGDRLSIPCQVVTKPARDERYTDIVRVLPAATTSNRRGYR